MKKLLAAVSFVSLLASCSKEVPSEMKKETKEVYYFTLEAVNNDGSIQASSNIVQYVNIN